MTWDEYCTLVYLTRRAGVFPLRAVPPGKPAVPRPAENGGQEPPEVAR